MDNLYLSRQIFRRIEKNFYSSWVDKNGNKFLNGSDGLLNFGKNIFSSYEKMSFYIYNPKLKKVRVIFTSK